MVMVAKEIKERALTQSQAAEYLGVTQPRISDLICGKVHKFTLDTLVEMLYALDKHVVIHIDAEKKNWDLVVSSPGSNKEFEDSIEYYTNAIAITPTDTRIIFERGMAYSRLGKHDLAIGDFTRCLEIDPNSECCRGARALEYAALKQFKAALLDLEEQKARFPEDNIYQNRALIYEEMGELEKAMEDHTKAIQMDPQRPGPHVNRAGLNERLGKIEEAIRDYENTLVADPTYQSAKNRLKELREKQKESS